MPDTNERGLVEITAETFAQLQVALEQADLYLNSYDTSAPSRIKATTRLNLEVALGRLNAEQHFNAAANARRHLTVTCSECATTHTYVVGSVQDYCPDCYVSYPFATQQAIRNRLSSEAVA